MRLGCPSKLACLLLHVYLPVRTCVCMCGYESVSCVSVCAFVCQSACSLCCTCACVCEKSKRKRYAANSGRKVSLLLFKNVCQCMCIVKGIINNRRSLTSLSLSLSQSLALLQTLKTLSFNYVIVSSFSHHHERRDLCAK